ncbi:Tripartite tricarboxylate transporter family receptor [Pigmentiphaga humi]|uniref:Tripartite tricarboxylate transporter family receptor n=1 Tax=Pigmentiphaga humi TaxID=2478468 RepID=A0A3P4AZN8_9BURK|nr:tripartite tricarboxylate transporter substrate binding protein [Pigmentiphaga humi]VCU69524.1 Tripartite tricarboxylate transporter family receptor [Pigmentiphaga humi]
MNHRNVLPFRAIGCAVLVLASLAGAASAQSQPRQIRMVVPFSPGGPADLIARKLGERLGPQMDATVIIDNRPGANGVIGVQAVAKAAPDGSTLLFATSGMLTISPVLYKDLSYDPLKDLSPIGRVVANGSALLVGRQLPANNMKEFVAYAQKSSAPVAIGSAGTGNITHLYMELMKDATRGNFVHVPYKGVAPALTDVMGGQIAGVFVDLPAALPLLQSGRVKALGLVGAERSASAPDIPTIAEQGYPGVDGVSWFGVLGPAGMSADRVAAVHAALGRALAEPELVKALKDIGSQPALDQPAEMAALMRSEQARWAQLIKARNIQVD